MRPAMLRAGVAMSAVAGLATGCGAGGTTSVAQPKPVEPASAVIPRMNKAIADQSCAELAPLVIWRNRLTYRPGAPLVRGECPSLDGMLQFMRGGRFVSSATYGTAAVLEGRQMTREKGRAHARTLLGVLVLDRDRRFRLESSGALPRLVRANRGAGRRFGDHNVRAILVAVRTKDCRELSPLIDAAVSPLARVGNGRQSAGTACKRMVNGKIFAPSLAASPHARAILLGQTPEHVFYGVSTRRSYFTIVMDKEGFGAAKPPLLYDSLPNTNNSGLPNR